MFAQVHDFTLIYVKLHVPLLSPLHQPILRLLKVPSILIISNFVSCLVSSANFLKFIMFIDWEFDLIFLVHSLRRLDSFRSYFFKIKRVIRLNSSAMLTVNYI